MCEMFVHWYAGLRLCVCVCVCKKLSSTATHIVRVCVRQALKCLSVSNMMKIQ